MLLRPDVKTSHFCIFFKATPALSNPFDPTYRSCSDRRMRLIIFAILMLSATLSLAANYSGRISKSGHRLHLTDDSDRQLYVLSAATPLIAGYLNKLSEGDFLSFDGVKNYSDGSFTIKSINYIGLAQLLGTWFGDDMYCYTFKSFTEFTISRRIGNRCLTSNKPGYTYVLSPSNDNWVIIISAQHGGNYIGELDLAGGNEAEIRLYDPETGDTLRSVYLRK